MIEKFDAMVVRVEELFTEILLATIAVLVFFSAVTRKLGMPINWAQDFSLLEFAWLTFIGSDLLMRTTPLITIDLILLHLPKIVQKVLAILFDLGMLLFLYVLVRYGFPLVTQSWSRVFNTLPLSYAWCTLCVPVGSLLMCETTIVRLVRDIKKPVSAYGKEGEDA